jgi:uncharacterized membrane protein YidH (DUF202 family)
MQNQLKNLNRFNKIVSAVLAVEGLLILKFEPAIQKLVPKTTEMFTLSLPNMIAAFLLLSALALLIISTVYRKRYEADLKLGINRGRWIEYSITASIMMVAISMLVGIYDAASLAMIFGLVAIMNLCGLVMEIHNQTTKQVNWISYVVGCIAGAIPWLVVAFYFWTSSHYGGSQPPTFVYWIFVSIFVFFNCFAINMILQYKKVGKWKDYIYGERVYIILSLVAKSLLAWQVFAGTLRP